jgi:predicted metal-dependent hydrolase
VQLDLPFTSSFSPLIEFRRHPRARRYTIRVSLDGGVRVTMPRWGSKREAGEFARRESSWIEKQRRRIHEQRSRAQVLTPEAETALRETARRELSDQLLELAAKHGLAVSRVSVRNPRWRWGSCSSAGHISLNWRLIQVPSFVRDYVFIHELMHLKRHDHSPKFWRLVADACPDYQAARTWLREHGHVLTL